MKQVVTIFHKARRLFAVLLLMQCHVSLGATEVWKSPQVMFKSTSKLSIQRVEFGQDATHVTFEYCATPFSWLRLGSRVVAIDNHGKHHPAISTNGIELDSTLWLSESGKAAFSISFAPIPEGCECFDILSSSNNEGIRIYGIQKKKAKRMKSSRGTVFSGNYGEINVSIPDTVVIRGHFLKDGTGNNLPQEISFSSLKDAMTDLSTIHVSETGDFMFSFVSSHPVWGNMFCDNQIIQFFGWPGDTLDITVSQWKRWNETIVYQSKNGKPSFENLMLHGDYMEGASSLDHLNWPDFQRASKDLLTNGLSLAEYIVRQYGLSEDEAHLLQNQMKLQYIYRVLFYISNVNAEHYIHPHLPRMITKNDFIFIQAVNWQDSSLLCTRGWGPHFCSMILQVLLHDVESSNNWEKDYIKHIAPYMPDMHELIYKELEKAYEEITSY